MLSNCGAAGFTGSSHTMSLPQYGDGAPTAGGDHGLSSLRSLSLCNGILIIDVVFFTGSMIVTAAAENSVP